MKKSHPEQNTKSWNNACTLVEPVSDIFLRKITDTTHIRNCRIWKQNLVRLPAISLAKNDGQSSTRVQRANNIIDKYNVELSISKKEVRQNYGYNEESHVKGVFKFLQ